MAQRVSSSRFVGRLRELEELASMLSAGARNELPVLCFLAGESGIGKTRLLRELIDSAEAQGATAIGGSCIELGDDELPYAPLVAALRPLHRTCRDALDALPASARAELARLNPGIGEPSVEPEGERGEAQRRLFDAFIELISRLGEEGPVLLWIEDIHWADRSTRSFLRFLSAALSEERVLVVATYRADELHRRHPLRPLLAELERSERARRIELARFDAAELEDQFTDILGEAPDREAVNRLFSRSEGNPLFTEELLAAGTDGRGSLPPSLREALLLRSERMSEPAQGLLRMLAVVGRAGEELLGAASELAPDAISAALREGMDAQIVILDGDRFALRHALLREVLYDDLLPGQRAELHLRIAGALEEIEPAGEPAWTATAVAHHYFAAGDQPRALSSALSAAAAVRGLHAYGEAAGLLDRALALWARVEDPEGLSGIDEGQLLADAARVHYLDGEDAVAMALYERAVDATGPAASDPERLATLLTALATCQWSLGRAELSRETQRRGLDLLPPEGKSPARAALLAQQVRFLLLQGRFREVCEAAPEAIDLTTELGMDSARAGVLNRFGCALFSLGREEEGHERMAEAIEIAERTGNSDDLATVYLNYADALHLVGRGIEAREIAERGVARVQDRIEVSEGGSSRSMRFIWLNLAEIHFDLGEWERADAELAQFGSVNQGTNRAHGYLRAAQLDLARGRDQEAQGALDSAEDLLRDALEPQYIAMLAVFRAESEVRRGRLDRARAAIDDGVDRIQFCSEDGGRIALTAAAGVTVEAEVAERARDVSDREAEEEAIGRASWFGQLAAAAAADGGRVEGALLVFAEAEGARAHGEDDPALWDRAAEAWRGLERPYPEAIARWRQSAAALARADREAAKAPLAEAAAIAERLGASWLSGEVDGLAARARLSLEPVSVTENGEAHAVAELPFGLTPRELQVLELVSSGATNREIGERLFMAEKTASVHVSRILAKLEVRGRTEAAAVAHRHGIGREV